MSKKRRSSGWDGQVPFDQQGDLLSYGKIVPKEVYDRKQKKWMPLHIEWRPKYEFEAVLTYLKPERGRFGQRLIFEDEETGCLYPMFISELKYTLQNAIVNGDKFSGRWTFRKQGQSFSVCHARD